MHWQRKENKLKINSTQKCIYAYVPFGLDDSLSKRSWPFSILFQNISQLHRYVYDVLHEEIEYDGKIRG